MTPLEYWTKRFPDVVPKLSQQDRDLLARHRPPRITVHDERDFRNMLVLLWDFDKKQKEGKELESLIYKSADKELSEYFDKNVTKNNIAQMVATGLACIGLSGIDYMDNLTLAGLFTSALGISMLGFMKWGIRKTNSVIWKKTAEILELPDTPEVRAQMNKPARSIIRMLMMIPLCGITAITVGLVMSAGSYSFGPADWVAYGGGAVLLADLIAIFWMAYKK